MNKSELDFPKLIEIETKFLCARPTREKPEPVADKILAMGLLYAGWNPKVPRFAVYGEASSLGHIKLWGVPYSILVENSCLDVLFKDQLIAGFLGSEVRFALTRQGDELVREMFEPEIKSMVLPTLNTSH